MKGKVEETRKSARLQFSLGMETLGKEVRTGAVNRWRKRPRNSLKAASGVNVPVTMPPIDVTGRSSPTDRELTRLIDEPTVVQGVPGLPSVVISSTLCAPETPILLTAPLTEPTPPQPPLPRLSTAPLKSSLKPPSAFIGSRSLSAPTHPTPHFLSNRSQRISPLSRQSYPAPLTIDPSYDASKGGPNSSALSEEDESEEDDLPLAELRTRRTSLLTLSKGGKSLLSPILSPTDSASSETSTVQARSMPPTPTLPAAVPESSSSREPMPRSTSRDRVLRFASDTVDNATARDVAAATKRKEEAARRREEVARRAEEEETREKERIRVEAEEAERERKRQDRLREEVRNARERREKVKLGERKGNGGKWEEPAEQPQRSSMPRKSESSRTLSIEVAPTRTSTSRLVSTGGEGRKVDHWGPRSTHERPPSLVSNTATSSPQTDSPRSSNSSLHNLASGGIVSPSSTSKQHPSRSASSSNIHSRSSLHLPVMPSHAMPYQHQSQGLSPSYSAYGLAQPVISPSGRSPQHHARSYSQSHMFPSASAPPQLAYPISPYALPSPYPLTSAGYIAPPPALPAFNPYFPAPPQPFFAQPASYSQPSSPKANRPYPQHAHSASQQSHPHPSSYVPHHQLTSQQASHESVGKRASMGFGTSAHAVVGASQPQQSSTAPHSRSRTATGSSGQQSSGGVLKRQSSFM